MQISLTRSGDQGSGTPDQVRGDAREGAVTKAAGRRLGGRGDAREGTPRPLRPSQLTLGP